MERAIIDRFLQNSPLGLEEIAVLTAAYERTLRELRLVDRNDPITEMIAKKIIELRQRGVREAKQLSALAKTDRRIPCLLARALPWKKGSNSLSWPPEGSALPRF